MQEVPLLVARTPVFGDLKPEIKFIELVQTEGGFIAGHYEVVFKVGCDWSEYVHVHTVL